MRMSLKGPDVDVVLQCSSGEASGVATDLAGDAASDAAKRAACVATSL